MRASTGWLVAMGLLGLVAACHKSVRRAPPADAAVAQAESSCARDEDCEVSCVIAGECCGQVCECWNVYNSVWLEKEHARQQRDCHFDDCPRAECGPPPTDEIVARCQGGRCVSERRPR